MHSYIHNKLFTNTVSIVPHCNNYVNCFYIKNHFSTKRSLTKFFVLLPIPSSFQQLVNHMQLLNLPSPITYLNKNYRFFKYFIYHLFRFKCSFRFSISIYFSLPFMAILCILVLATGNHF